MGAVTACVPALPDVAAGAVGFVVTPSPGARGEPFVSGSFTVTVERLDVCVSVQTNTRSEEFLIDTTREASFYAPAVPSGSQKVMLFPCGEFSSEDRVLVSLSSERAKRFSEPADLHYSDPQKPTLPKLVIELRGRSGAREVRLALSVDLRDPSFADYVYRSCKDPAGASFMPTSSSQNSLMMDIPRDGVVYGKLRVQAEKIFDELLSFDELAGLDQDGNGRVDAAELEKGQRKGRGAKRKLGAGPDDTEPCLYKDLFVSQLSTKLFRLER